MLSATAAAAAAAEDCPPAQELQTHISVAVRVRGLDAHEDLAAIFPTEADAAKSLVIDGPGRPGAGFSFDHVFWSLGESKRWVRGVCVCGRGGGGSSMYSLIHPEPAACLPTPTNLPTHSKYPAFVHAPAEASQEAIYQRLGRPVVQDTLAVRCHVGP